MMIAHHEGAISQSETVKANGSNPDVLALADQIITAQQGEITEMQAPPPELNLSYRRTVSRSYARQHDVLPPGGLSVHTHQAADRCRRRLHATNLDSGLQQARSRRPHRRPLVRRHCRVPTPLTPPSRLARRGRRWTVTAVQCRWLVGDAASRVGSCSQPWPVWSSPPCMEPIPPMPRNHDHHHQRAEEHDGVRR
jgi:hypothetical protein